ncbi:unnamed protein product [Prorocentrum cordatum]|uniref:Uncharacterized protein n=1 Tax=Prorocentrum cordatum TaxID=2364126 RepID=A0ABN9WUM6_9DINO|nr:unnamed protein product [Polarella glacialis]
MAVSMKLRVQLSEQTAEWFKYQGIDINWDNKELLTVTCQESPLTIEEVSSWIEARVENMYDYQTGGKDRQGADPDPLDQETHGARGARLGRPRQPTPQGDGDTIIVDCMAITDSMARRMRAQRPQYTEEDLEEIRKKLRFDLNDRVLCFCGPRWLSGHVVGSAVPDDDTLLPYLVKTDPVPGLPSKTISVPSDRDEVCTQEVCFDPESELHLVKSAATLLAGSQRPKLRFAAGDKVACRLKNDPKDGLETWVAGVVSSIWPELPGERKWQIENISGEFPSVVAYKVDFSTGGWVYCHRDHHALIRRDGMQPQTRVKGISKRMEVRKANDGSREQVDHQTERRKRMLESDSDGDSDVDPQRKR